MNGPSKSTRDDEGISVHQEGLSPKVRDRVATIVGGGEPILEQDREYFEGKFDKDFREVRVHSDADASSIATEISAEAFTLRNHVVFGPVQHDPESEEGKHLLAHELTHVVQQTSLPSKGKKTSKKRKA